MPKADRNQEGRALSVGSIMAITGLALQGTLSVDWEAPPECPDAKAVARRLAEEGVAPTSAVVLRAVVTREPDGYSLIGELRAQERSQELDFPYGMTCDALLDDLALYLALAYEDPEPRAAPPPTGGYLRLMATGERGSLHMCAPERCERAASLPGAAFAGGWRRGGLRVELGIPLYTLKTLAPPWGGFGALTSHWYLTGLHLRVCGAFERRAFELVGCGALALRVLIGAPGEPDGFRRSISVIPWAAAGLGVAAIWWFHERAGVRIEAAPGVDFHKSEYSAFDEVAGAAPQRRLLVEIGRFHVAFGIGVDLRLGANVKRSRH